VVTARDAVGNQPKDSNMSPNKLADTPLISLPTTPSNMSDDIAPGKPPRRVAAASRKKTKDEAPKRSGKLGHAASKQTQVIEMLQRRHGVTIATVMKATGWQPHSVRGFFAGVVRNKLGLNLVSDKTGEQRIYRIVARTTSAKRKGKSPGKAA
jgi:hypothetical protein